MSWMQGRRAIGMSVLLGLVGTASSFAATLTVPQQFPTIQAAIDASATGDIISVAPGAYHENLDFEGKGIRVASTGGAAVTTIIGASSSYVLYFRQYETRATAVSGFTLEQEPGGSIGSFGYIAYASDASPTLTDNIFQGDGTDAVAVEGFASSMLLERNLFTGWTCQPGVAAVWFANESSPSIKNNVFLNNHCPALNLSLPYGSVPDVANNTFVLNDVAIELDGDVDSHQHLYRNNLIVGNGTGLMFDDVGATANYPTFQNNLVYGNTQNYVGIPDQTGIHGNLSVDPQLGGLSVPDFHPDAGSPVIGAGLTAAVDVGETDFYGMPRLRYATSGLTQVDVGAAQYLGTQPTIVFNSSATSLDLGAPVTLSWSSANAGTCTAAGSWSGPLPLSGSRTFKPAGGSYVYDVICGNAAATRMQSNSLTVYPPPIVTIAFSPAVINEGSVSKLTWSVSNATQCQKSGAWSGTASLAGSLVLSPVAGTYQYGLTCTGYNGTTKTSAQLTVSPAPPFSTLNLVPSVGTTYAIATMGQAAPSGGLDGHGYAYASALTGTQLSWDGQDFQLGQTGQTSALKNATISLTPYQLTSLSLLATGVNGNQLNQKFVVTYTDGTQTVYTQNLSDWKHPQGFPGESIAMSMPYRISPTGSQDPGPYYIYGYRILLDPSRTVLSLALPHNGDVAVLAINYNIPPQAFPDFFSLQPNVDAFGSLGSPALNGGLDGHGYSYDAYQLPVPFLWAGQQFFVGGSSNTPSSISNMVFKIGSAHTIELDLLATAVNGSQQNQTFVVTYTDGTTAVFKQSLSDWRVPQHYPGESIAATTSDRITPSGTQQAGPWYVYGYTFLTDGAKSIQSLTLPANRDVIVLGVNSSVVN